MEGFGTRIVRASSRYASASFKGPVRKWKRGWVPVAGSRFRPRRHHQLPEKEKPDVLLCRWTRLSDQPEPTTKRKFRYTPVVVLEENKKKKMKEAAALKVYGRAKGKEVKEFKPVTREDMLMESDDDNDNAEEPEDKEYFANLNMR